MNLLVKRGVVYARANWGRWLVDCPSCPSALGLPPGTPVYSCWDCDAVAEIVWPANPRDIERLLLMRPDPMNRNWEPGESLQDLYLENVDHGVLPVADLTTFSGLAFKVGDDKILVDNLPLPAVRRRQIGD